MKRAFTRIQYNLNIAADRIEVNTRRSVEWYVWDRVEDRTAVWTVVLSGRVFVEGNR